TPAAQPAAMGQSDDGGRFQLLERVGVGAFGTVWRAQDRQLDRLVALKIPHASLGASEKDLARFYREARAAGELRHPAIVTVHEVVTYQGLPPIVTDPVVGVALKDFLEERPLTFRESATLVAEMADALDYAHALGLVHRDMKPANILLEWADDGSKGAPDRAWEDRPAALAKPRIVDFGLALRADADITLTLEGD